MTRSEQHGYGLLGTLGVVLFVAPDVTSMAFWSALGCAAYITVLLALGTHFERR